MTKFLKPIVSLSLLFTLIDAKEEQLHKALYEQDTNIYNIQREMEARIRLSYEILPLSANDNMGIVGIHYDIFPSKKLPYFYTGVGIYGGATGAEGGFFTFGFTAGIKYPLLTHTSVDGGYFVGAGGGSRDTFPGPGLMTRASLGLEQKYNIFAIRAGVAHTAFPGTTNDTYARDTHAYFGLSLESNIWESISLDEALKEKLEIVAFDRESFRLRIAPSILYYDVDNKPVKRADRFFGAKAYQQNMLLLGVQIERFVTENIFLSFETYGAGKNAAGYMTIHSGLGYVLPLTSFLNWENKLIVGLGGDGRIDTGGGLLVQPMSGLSIPITDSLLLKGLLGRTIAPDGKFSATTADFAISWQGMKAESKGGSAYSFNPNRFNSIPWSIAVGMKFYQADDSARQTDGTQFDPVLGLIGLDLGMPLNDYLDIVGNTYWAMHGDIGSYAEGMLGFQAHTAPLTPLQIKPMLGAEIGVAGGGRMVVDGFLYQLSGGVAIPTGLGFDLELKAGRTKTTGDSFSANTYTLKLNWNQISFFEK